MARVRMYSRFLRLWHWLQALLVIMLLLTGFEVHGSYRLFGFEHAVDYHKLAAWSLLGLWALARSGISRPGMEAVHPSPIDRVIAMLRYYGVGIFRGEPHPFHKDRWHRHNHAAAHGLSVAARADRPGDLDQWSRLYQLSVLGTVWARWIVVNAGRAGAHTAAAFLMLTFLVAHLYLALTTSEAPFAYLRG